MVARLGLVDASSGTASGGPGVARPAASSVGDLQRRHDLTRNRHRLQPPPSDSTALLTVADAPNRRWAIGFKGWFRTGEGVRREPLTITDGFRCYLLKC